MSERPCRRVSVRRGTIERDLVVLADLEVSALVEHLRRALGGTDDEPLDLRTAAGQRLAATCTLATAGIVHGTRLLLVAPGEAHRAGCPEPPAPTRTEALRRRFGSASP